MNCEKKGLWWSHIEMAQHATSEILLQDQKIVFVPKTGIEGLRKTIYYLQRLDDVGVTFRSFTEQYLDTCGIFRDVVIGLMATLAQQERLRISERTKAGLARVRSRGKRLGRPRLKDLSNASRATIWRHKKTADCA